MSRVKEKKKRGDLFSLSFSFLFVFLFSFCFLFIVEGVSGANTLVAYYYFDGNTLIPYSGICPFPPYLASPKISQGSPGYATNTRAAGQGIALRYSNNDGYLNAGGWAINSPNNALTLSAWVYASAQSNNRVWYPITKQSNSGSRIIWQIGWSKTSGVSFTVATSASSALTVSTNGLTTGVWYLVTGVYNDGGQMKLYVNTAMVASRSTNGQIPYEDASTVYVGYSTSQSWNVLVDEARIYNYALTAAQVSSLFALSVTQRPPTLTMSPSAIFPLGSAAQVFGTPVGGTPPYSYTWAILGGCVSATFSPPSSSPTNVTVNGGVVYETYTLQLGVTDTLLCATGTTSITLDGNTPGYDTSASTYPTNGVFQVPEGSSASINVVLTGQPTPRIQWQELVDLNSRRELKFVHGMFEDEDTKEMRITAVLSRCNSTANFTANCSTWLDITNETSATYTSPIGDATLAGTQIRFVLTNVKGNFISSPVRIAITAPATSSSSSGSGGDGGGTDVGAIVGPIVGVITGLCCLLLICLAIVIGLLILRRKIVQSGEFPGIPPDYDQVIFGTFFQPVFKIKSKQDKALEELESLLTSDQDFLVATAISRGANRTYEENLARDYVYVFAAHNQCEDLIKAFIVQVLEVTEDPSTMFRANTVDSKMFKYFSLLVAAPYLWEVLAPFVWEIQKQALVFDMEEEENEAEQGTEGRTRSATSSSTGRKSTRRVLVGMELDPTRMDEAADPKVNTLQLWLTAQKIFSSVTHSTSDMPKELADILVYVYQSVASRFSGEEYKAMGGFLFLRYICPSLLAPHLYGLLESPPSPTAQRQLILVGKVLQNLANNTLPGNKEDYMQRLNEFITNNQSDLLDFYNQILSASNLSTANREVPTQVKKNALADIYNILLASKDGVYQELGNYYGEGDPIFNQIEEILKHGPIPSEQS